MFFHSVLVFANPCENLSVTEFLLTEAKKDRERRTYHPYEYTYREWKKVIRLLLRKETGEEEEESLLFLFLSLFTFSLSSAEEKEER